MHYNLGLPMWQHKEWKGTLYSAEIADSEALQQYASVFNTVEGNTSFYALPSEEKVQSWNESTPNNFNFSFKLPKLITHDRGLINSSAACSDFFNRMAPLRDKMGPVMIQLPVQFGPSKLDVLEKFIRQLSMEFSFAIELRHKDFFHGDNEQRLLDMLQKYRVDKVNFDSRALFTSTATDTFTLDAKKKKPLLPVNLIATSNQPIIRFIGHETLSANDCAFTLCADAIIGWIKEGKRPYLFAHFANNAEAYLLAEHLHKHLQSKIQSLNDLPSWPAARENSNGQIGLF